MNILKPGQVYHLAFRLTDVNQTATMYSQYLPLCCLVFIYLKTYKLQDII